MLNKIRVVMLKTTHSGNIGAAARAMKTMGLDNLYLVSPKSFPDPEATARATGATDILENAQVYTTLEEAISDCPLVLGASARRRSIDVPTLNPRLAAQWIQQNYQDKPVAVLFGRERDGLSNDELDQCQRLITIPANPEYSSLNIASAVQVLAYELRMTALDMPTALSNISPSEEERATANDLNHLWQHMETTLNTTQFLHPGDPGHVMRKLQRMFQRADLSAVEVRILRGVLSSIDKKIER